MTIPARDLRKKRSAKAREAALRRRAIIATALYRRLVEMGRAMKRQMRGTLWGPK